MTQATSHDVVRAGVSESEMRERCIHLVFAGDSRRFEAFCSALAAGVPAIPLRCFAAAR